MPSANTMQDWENLFVPTEILKVLEEENFYKPSEIQRKTLPVAIRDRKDILGAAATGTGKTLAFGIPMIARVINDKKQQKEQYEKSLDIIEVDEDVDIDDDEEENKDNENEADEESNLSPSESEMAQTWKDDEIVPKIPVGVGFNIQKPDNCLPYQHIYGLVLTPTRELAVQVTSHLKKACKYTDLKVEAIFGGMSVEKQERKLRAKPEILVVTPGRFWSFITDENQMALSARKLSVLVIDEADRMVESGHFQELEYITQWLSTATDKDRIVCDKPLKPRQTLLFSATLTFVHLIKLKNKKKTITKKDKLNSFIENFGINNKPAIIDLSMKVDKLHQWRINCPDQASKDTKLYWFMSRHIGRTIVFTNSQNAARRLRSVLTTMGILARCLSGHMKASDRLKTLDKFKSEPHGVLVATDVAARGLDIPNIDFVIHFDTPRVVETLVHRTGRTARAHQAGHSVLILAPADAVQMRKLDETMQKTDTKIVEGDGYMEQYKELPYDAEYYRFEEVITLGREVEVKLNRFRTYKNEESMCKKISDSVGFDIDCDSQKRLDRMSTSFGDMKQLKVQEKVLKHLINDLKQFTMGKKCVPYPSPIYEIHPHTNPKEAIKISQPVVTGEKRKNPNASEVSKKKRSKKQTTTDSNVDRVSGEEDEEPTSITDSVQNQTTEVKTNKKKRKNKKKKNNTDKHDNNITVKESTSVTNNNTESNHTVEVKKNKKKNKQKKNNADTLKNDSIIKSVKMNTSKPDCNGIQAVNCQVVYAKDTK